jgi:tetratricopeptide (TPR) repeat protein
MRSDPLAAAAVRDRLARATALEVSHRYDGARSLAAEAVALARDIDDALLAEALSRQARILHEAGDYRGEAVSAEEAHMVAEAVGHDELAAQVATLRVFTTAQVENDYATAKTWARHADAAIERMPAGSRELARARLDVMLAHIAQGEGRIEDATRLLAGAVERLERYDDVSASELAGVYNDQASLSIERDPEAALAHLGQALTLIRAHYGEHPQAAKLVSNIAAVHYYRGEFALAAKSFDEAARLLETILGEHHHDVAGAYMNLAMVQDELGDELAARASMARAIEIFRVALGPDHPDLAVARTNVGAFELDNGDLDAAEAAFRQALATLESTVGPDHIYCTNALRGLAEVALARGRAQDAVALHQRALAIDETHGTGPAEVAMGRLTLAQAQAQAGDRRAGEATVRAAIDALAHDREDGDAQARVEVLAELNAWLLDDAAVTAAVAGSG